MNYGIIAAGKGERLTSEGISLPKPLVAPAGEPLIRRLIRIMSMPGGEAAMTRLGVIVREPEIAGSVREACASLGIDAPLDLTVKATADSMLSFAEVTGRFKGDFIVTTVDTVFEQSEMIRLAEAFAARTDADGYMGVSEYADDEKPLWVSTDADGSQPSPTDAATTPATCRPESTACPRQLWSAWHSAAQPASHACATSSARCSTRV